jgi:hypothetical protein
MGDDNVSRVEISPGCLSAQLVVVVLAIALCLQEKFWDASA